MTAEGLREAAIEGSQRQIEVDEPEEDVMTLLVGNDEAAEDDMSEERLLRALMEAQGES
jgi:DNA-directed RNA polymerase subunit omega